MNLAKVNLKPKFFLFAVIFLQLAVCVTVFFDIPVARQVLGFAYFTFIPGFIITKLIKLYKLNTLDALLFSVGLSIAFLMFAGLFINEFGLLLGMRQPLSLMPLMIVLNSIILLLSGVLVYSRKEDFTFFIGNFLKSSPLVSFLVVPSILSIIGAIWANVFKNNLILLLMLMMIPLSFMIGIISKKLTSPKLYPFIVFVIAISLLYHSSFISNYIYAGDVHMEYFIFETVKNNARWDSVFMYHWDVIYGRLNSMLSITILPTIYSILLNIDATWVFKIIYPLIFSLVPLALYALWQKSIGEKWAFTSAFLFMATGVFYTELLGLNRQMIGELFFVMLLLIVLSKDTDYSKKMAFIIFSVALIISHYSLAEIFLIFTVSLFILSALLKRQSGNLTLSMVSFFFVTMFTWYVYTSSSAIFYSFLNTWDNLWRQLGDFLNPASRGQFVLRGLGLEAPPSIWNAIGRAFAYITEAFIAIGFVGMSTKRVKMSFKSDYCMLSFVAMVFLTALILVPGLANTLNMTRFYHLLLFFLAPFCIFGAEVMVGLVSKRRTELYTSILLLVVLVPYFLFQTGFVYEVTRVQSWSLPLSKYRMDSSILMCNFAYVNSWKVFGASWLSEHLGGQTEEEIYKDLSAHELVSYGMLRYAQYLSNTTRLSSGDVVYLSYLNVVEGVVVTPGGRVFNTTELSFILDANLLYSNGGCQIYKLP